MEELLLILFFLVLVLAFAGAAAAYLRLLRSGSRQESEARLETLAQLREQIRQLEEKLARVSSQRQAPLASQAFADSQALIEAELRRRGFSKIRVLPLPENSEADAGEFPVEAMKDQIEFKGRVVLRDGVVVECRLQPSYEVFP